MQQQTFYNLIEILKYALANNISLSKASEHFGFNKEYARKVRKVLENQKEDGDVDEERYKTYRSLMDVYEGENDTTFKQVNKTSKYTVNDTEKKDEVNRFNLDDCIFQDEEVYEANELINDNIEDERLKVEIRRDNLGKIKEYYYYIKRKYQMSIEGVFTRKEMERIYQLYPYVTQNTLSTEFPKLTVKDIGAVLRAFKITKDKLLPEHILEEADEEQRLAFVRKAKERVTIKQASHQQSEYYKKQFKLLSDEYNKERTKKQEFSTFLNVVENEIKDVIKNNLITPINNYSIDNVKRTRKDLKATTLFASLSDIHFGKYYEIPKRYKRLNIRGTSKDILTDRLFTIANQIANEANSLNIKHICINMIGDVFESVYYDGMHANHLDEMDLVGSKQFCYGFDSMLKFFNHLLSILPEDIRIEVFSVGGNHDRIGRQKDHDPVRQAHHILLHTLQSFFKIISNNISFNFNPDESSLEYERDNVSIIMFHGDNALNKRKGEEIITTFKETALDNYTVILNGHWHTMRMDEGLKFVRIGVGSVCSIDNFSNGELGKGSLPSFIMGHRSDTYGFDFRKITLY